MVYSSDGREELLNPDCSAVNLLEYIKKVIDWDRHGKSVATDFIESFRGNNKGMTITPV